MGNGSERGGELKALELTHVQCAGATTLDRILKDRLRTNRLGQDTPAFQFRDNTSGRCVEIGGACQDNIGIRRRFFCGLAPQ